MALCRLPADPAVLPGRRLERSRIGATWILADPRINHDVVVAACTHTEPEANVTYNITFKDSDARGSTFGGTHNVVFDSQPGTNLEEDLRALSALLDIVGRRRHELSSGAVDVERLAAAERTVRDAVDQRLPNSPESKRAVRHILQVAGHLLIGVAGNTLFAYLDEFAPWIGG